MPNAQSPFLSCLLLYLCQVGVKFIDVPLLMLFYVVVYDIPCDKRRKAVSDLLEGYGRRVQYSVFECVLTGPKYEELQKRLRKRVKLEEDSVRFYVVPKHMLGQVDTWGVGPPLTPPPSSVVL
ncbi:MAG: CRISPR-associated endonuclease Cas2 [Oscillatoria princeps RMCB-10]|jgi:CRISPR-associated protein Cas2|nr:CRISPR-associated endonuclease Cas2 [Oscillatoria princeps RMCB-10]